MLTATLDPLFHALADSTRRDILGLLRTGERSTGEIARAFPLSRPTISKHLRVLYEARLVQRRKRGRNQMYDLSPDPLAAAHDWLADYRRFWEQSLDNLKRQLEEETP